MKKDNRYETVLTADLISTNCVPIFDPCHAHIMSLLIGMHMKYGSKNISNTKKCINTVNLKGRQPIKIKKFQK